MAEVQPSHYHVRIWRRHNGGLAFGKTFSYMSRSKMKSTNFLINNSTPYISRHIHAITLNDFSIRIAIPRKITRAQFKYSFSFETELFLKGITHHMLQAEKDEISE